MEFTQDYVQAILDYNPYTGICLWKSRPRTDFKLSTKRSAWNKKHIGMEAGTVDPSTTRLKVSLFGKTFYLDQLIWIYVYGEQPTTIHHINGWQVDNSLKNLTLDKSLVALAPTRYAGGDLTLFRYNADFLLQNLIVRNLVAHYAQRHHVPDRYLITAEAHCLGIHADVITARTHMLEICEYLQCGWQDTTSPFPALQKYYR